MKSSELLPLAVATFLATHLLTLVQPGLSAEPKYLDPEFRFGRLIEHLKSHRSFLIPLETAPSQIEPDTRLSEAATPARFYQDAASLVAVSDGSFLLVWEDEREGTRKIYGQRLSSGGLKVGSNLLLAGSTNGAFYGRPQINLDSLSRVHLLYLDQTNGLLFGSRYSTTFTEQVSPYLVNDTTNNSFAFDFDMAVFPDGRLVVAWANITGTSYSIQMAILAANGSVMLGPVAVSTVGSQRRAPSVALQSGGGFLIAWEQEVGAQTDVYARQYTGGGAAVGSQIALVPPGPDLFRQLEPEVIFSPLDNAYLVAWVDLRSGREIFGQLFSPLSGLSGGNVPLTAVDTVGAEVDINLAISSSGRVLASWATFRATNEIVTQVILPNMGLGARRVSNSNTVGQRWAPSIATRSQGRYAVAWTEIVDEPDIHFMLFDSLGAKQLSNEVLINDDSMGAITEMPDVVTATNWWQVAAWTDKRRDDGDIFIQSFNNAGGLAGPNRRANQDAAGGFQVEPALAVSDDKVLLVWTDIRTIGGIEKTRVFGRYLSVWGTFTGSEFIISDTFEVSLFQVSAAMLSDGRALVIWQNDGIYGRWLTSGGELDGPVFTIFDQPPDQFTANPTVNTTAAEQFVVAMNLITQNPKLTIRTHIYSSDKTLAGSWNFDLESSVPFSQPVVFDVTPAGHVVAVWPSTDDDSLFFQAITSGGAPMTPKRLIIDDNDSQPISPALSIDENGYVATTWIDHREGSAKVYTQLYSPTFSTIGNNEPVADGSAEFMSQPDVAASRGRAWYVWVDPRTEGINVFANSLVYEPTFAEPETELLPTVFGLEQNFPNPFNPSTHITFQLPKAAEIKLKVYNVLGQEVATLFEGWIEAGRHTVTWDGNNRNGVAVASGMYVYRLDANQVHLSRKLLLLK